MPSRRALPTLDRMRELGGLLGDPQEAFPSVHITGTNGKGSTAAMVTALLGARGLTVGTYTSPNLQPGQRAHRPERRAHRRRRPARGAPDPGPGRALMAEPPTRFELLTAAALTWFADEAVDVAVIEVGLGGGGTPPTWSTATWPWSPTSATTTPRCSAPPSRTSPGTSRASSRPGSRAVIGEPTRAGGPASARRPGRPAPRRSGCGVRLRVHGQPAGGGGPAGRPADPGGRLRRGAGPAARCPPGGQRRLCPGRRGGVLRRPLTRTWSRRRSPPCGCPAGSRSSAPPAGGGGRRPQRGRHDRAGPVPAST